jgi:hypothetical protein
VNNPRGNDLGQSARVAFDPIEFVFAQVRTRFVEFRIDKTELRTR